MKINHIDGLPQREHEFWRTPFTRYEAPEFWMYWCGVTDGLSYARTSQMKVLDNVTADFRTNGPRDEQALFSLVSLLILVTGDRAHPLVDTLFEELGDRRFGYTVDLWSPISSKTTRYDDGFNKGLAAK